MFRYSMKNNEKHPSCSCIIKMWFGSKHYMIWKCKALSQGLNNIAKQIDRELRLGQKPDSVLDKAIKWIKRARVGQFEVEVLFKSDNARDLLIYEYRALLACKEDPACLNVDYEPQCPKWISQADVEAYKKLREPLAVGQIISSENGAAKFRVKALKTANEPATV